MGIELGADLDANLFSELSPSGFFFAIRISFALPMFEQNRFPADWVETFGKRGYVMADPVMNWLYASTGAVRWSEINIPDPRGVLDHAAEFGLVYGAAVSCIDQESHGQRSFGSFARPDREFEDDEIAVLQRTLQGLHDSYIPPTNLTRAELEALGMIKNGLLMKEIACLLGVSEGAVKQRLKNAKSKLNAKTSTHAATMATSYGLI
ncbi:helix-turn-helix transcriptional regulator [Psychromarinibacter sediminicola]|nr:LuxR family transcriptional regulator [Psychromarinibacter sediminicola]